MQARCLRYDFKTMKARCMRYDLKTILRCRANTDDRARTCDLLIHSQAL